MKLTIFIWFLQSSSLKYLYCSGQPLDFKWSSSLLQLVFLYLFVSWSCLGFIATFMLCSLVFRRSRSGWQRLSFTKVFPVLSFTAENNEAPNYFTLSFDLRVPIETVRMLVPLKSIKMYSVEQELIYVGIWMVPCWRSGSIFHYVSMSFTEVHFPKIQPMLASVLNNALFIYNHSLSKHFLSFDKWWKQTVLVVVSWTPL